jgi:hypothetical protein
MQTWGSIRVHGMSMASCGAPASQTHISTVAGSDHEFYTMNTGYKGLGLRERAKKDKMATRASKL